MGQSSASRKVQDCYDSPAVKASLFRRHAPSPRRLYVQSSSRTCFNGPARFGRCVRSTVDGASREKPLCARRLMIARHRAFKPNGGHFKKRMLGTRSLPTLFFLLMVIEKRTLDIRRVILFFRSFDLLLIGRS